MTTALTWLQAGAQRSAQTWLEALARRADTPFAVCFADGGRALAGDGSPAFEIVFHTDAALLATLTRGHLGLLEACFEQQVDVHGDLGAAFAAAMATGIDAQARP